MNYSKGKGALLSLAPAIMVISFFMLIPIIIVFIYSFLEANHYGGVRWIFSTEAYKSFIFSEDFLSGEIEYTASYVKIFSRSLVLSILSTLICLLIGFPTAYYMATREPKLRNLLVFLITIPFWTNLLIRTFSWILILRDTGTLNTTLINIGIIDEPIRMLYTNSAILLGLVYTYVPFMVLPIYTAIEKLDKRLLEAGHDLYAKRRHVMRKIVIPLAKPGIIAGSILVLIPSLGAFIAPNLLGGGKKLMIGSLIYMQFTSSRNWPFGSAAAILLLSTVMIVLIYYAKKASQKNEVIGL